MVPTVFEHRRHSSPDALGNRRQILRQVLAVLVAASTMTTGWFAARALASPTCSIEWSNSDGGLWNNAANWSLNGEPLDRVPNPDDDVCVVLDGTYELVLDVNASINSLTLGGPSGTQTLSIGSVELAFGTDSTIDSNGVVNLGASSGTGNSLLRGATLTNNGRLNTLEGDGGIRYLRVNLVNSPSGTVSIGSANTVSDSVGGATSTTNDGRFILEAGGVYDLSGGSTFTPRTPGTMQFNLASNTAFGQLRSSTLVSLAGTADPVAQAGYLPPAGTRFPVVAATHGETMFDAVLNGFSGDYSDPQFVFLEAGESEPPLPSVYVRDSTVTEGCTAVVTLRRQGTGLVSTVAVTAQFTDSTSNAGDGDFDRDDLDESDPPTDPVTVSFEEDETEKSVAIDTFFDDENESPAETFAISLSNPSNATLVADPEEEAPSVGGLVTIQERGASPDGAWQMRGPGTACTTSYGTSEDPPQAEYRLGNRGPENYGEAPSVYSPQTWTFSTTFAGESPTVLDLDYQFSGFHAFFQVKADLTLFVIRAGEEILTRPLVVAGPADCCESPSGGFDFRGTTGPFEVGPGDVFGFRFGGANQDAETVLEGNLKLSYRDPTAVTNTLDEGPGSLRSAIEAANSGGGGTITFDLPGEGPSEITIGAIPLPVITVPLTIDGIGTTDRIGLKGTSDECVENYPGLFFGPGADGSVVRGFAIGNFSEGIRVSANDVLIENNYLGLDVNGAANGNCDGVVTTVEARRMVLGGPNPNQSNVISANRHHGAVLLGSDRFVDDHFVEGNRIGTDSTRESLIPNGAGTDGQFPALIVSNTSGMVRGNTIAGHEGYGILARSAKGFISGNSIYGNGVGGGEQAGILVTFSSNMTVRNNATIAGNGGLGIDLGSSAIPDGVNINDEGDTDGADGPNGLLNYPAISKVRLVGGNVQVTGTLDVPPLVSEEQPYLIDFYANQTCDESGYGEGQVWLGFREVLEPGPFEFELTLPELPFMDTPALTATTTRQGFPFGTSEFSQCSYPTPTLSLTGAGPVGESAGSAELTVSSSIPSGVDATVTIETADGTATDPDYGPAAGSVTIPARETSVTLRIPIVNDVIDEIEESFTVRLVPPVDNGEISSEQFSATVTIVDDDEPEPATTTTTEPPTTTTTTLPPATTTRVPRTTPSTLPQPESTTTTLAATTTTLPPPTTTITEPSTTTMPRTPTTIVGASAAREPTTSGPTTTQLTALPTTSTIAPTLPTQPPTTALGALQEPTTTTSTTLPVTTAVALPSPTLELPDSTAPSLSQSVVVAKTPTGKQKGTPGAKLQLSARGFQGCQLVSFTFDEKQLAEVPVDPRGVASVDEATIPPDASPGSHRLTAKCVAEGDQIAVASFMVVDQIHQSAFVSEIPRPQDIPHSARDIAISLFSGLLLILFVAIPAEVFNSTLDENYDELRAIFRAPTNAFAQAGKLRQSTVFSAFVAVGAVLYAALSPGFGLNPSTLALVLGLALALAVTTAGFGIPVSIYMRRNFGEWGRLAVLPGTLVVSAAFVCLSRLLRVQPGLLYGLLAGFTFRQELDDKQRGKLVAGSSMFVLTVCLFAWFVQSSLSSMVAQPDAGFWLIATDAALAGIFVIGLESLVIGMLPLKFLRGKSIMEWNRLTWALVFGLCASVFVLVFIRPSASYSSSYRSDTAGSYLKFAAILGLASGLFWLYFRIRPESWKPKRMVADQDHQFEDIERF